MSTTRTDVLSSAGNETSSSYVLPKPGRPVSDLILPAPGETPTRHGEGDVARSLGQRASALLECQHRFLGELRDCLVEFEADLGEATRARLQGHVRAAISVLEWCDEVQSDLQAEASWAQRGLQPIDLTSYCRDVAGRAAAEGVQVQVQGHREQPWWGDVSMLDDVVSKAMALVRARAGDATGVILEMHGSRDVAGLRVAGIGEPADTVDPIIVENFRAAAERLGARVAPDNLGPGGAGLVVLLPQPS